MRPDQQVSKRAVIYARTSADSEDKGLKLSIEEQLDACKNLAQSHGYNVIGKYFDRNRSGRTYPTGSAQELRAGESTGQVSGGLRFKFGQERGAKQQNQSSAPLKQLAMRRLNDVPSAEE